MSMKLGKTLLLGAAMLVATTAFAANKSSLHLSRSTTLNNQTLTAGDYTLAWDGQGPNVEVSILRGRDVIAKVPAKLVDLKAAPAYGTTTTRTNPDGSQSLSAIQFGGKKYALEFGGESVQAEASNVK
jgi:hypothetical protein